ncbi:MAG: hypothetical protein ACRD0W_00315 [Acidimicrobiales bacterium]
MATLVVQDAPVTGLDSVTFAAASALGDDAPTGGGIVLLVRNTDAATKVVTVVTPGTVRGLTVEDPQMTVPATTGLAAMPLVRSVFGAAAAITYSAVTGVTVAVVRLAR